MRFSLIEGIDTVTNQDNSNVDKVQEFDDTEIVVIPSKSGVPKFYYNNGKRLKLVPKEKQVEYAKEYENQIRKQELENDPDYDWDAELEKEKARQTSVYQGKSENIKKIKDKVKKSQMYHAEIDDDDDDKAKEKNKKKSAFNKMITNPSLADIEKDITTWANNLLLETTVKTVTKGKKKSVAPLHDVYADDITRGEIMLPVNQKKKITKKHKETKEVPYVFFFFDRSDSFQESKHPGKTQLGLDIQHMFEKYETGFEYKDEKTHKKVIIPPNSLILKTYYFGTIVTDNPNEVYTDRYHRSTAKEFAGVNVPDRLLEKIKEVTDDKHKANVVILTDHHNSALSPANGVEINGNVWLIFANHTDPNLQFVVHGSDHTQEYFFTNMQ